MNIFFGVGISSALANCSKGTHQDYTDVGYPYGNFQANKKGEFGMFCSVFCGNGHPGMKGKLIVE